MSMERLASQLRALENMGAARLLSGAGLVLAIATAEFNRVVDILKTLPELASLEILWKKNTGLK